MIFVNSMSDLFHKEIPAPFIEAVFDTMEKADWHTFQGANQALVADAQLFEATLRRRPRARAHVVWGVG